MHRSDAGRSRTTSRSARSRAVVARAGAIVRDRLGQRGSARPELQSGLEHRALGPGQLACERQPVTHALYDRLDEHDREAIAQAIDASPDFQARGLNRRDPQLERWLALTWGIWLGVDGIAEKTGLPAVQPPEEVHAMARGPLSAAGGLYEADLVVDALASAGYDVAGARRALDFGCSSGRVVRVLNAAFPEVGWSGCDPNRAAVGWASENLPGIDFFVSPQEPPLQTGESGAFDVIYAISIWSHFAPELGRRWFDEMHRLLAPGGFLMMTTHGLQSVAHGLANGRRSARQSAQIERALARDGVWYAAEFGASGDWGVVNQSWGTAFMTPEWVLSELCPSWSVREYAVGRNQADQDVYVLQRSSARTDPPADA